MAVEHQDENERFSIISELTNYYEIRSDACNTCQITYESLKEFEEDLRKHIHLENNLLFKKAIDLEEELLMDARYQESGK
jgi:regulator of cell morphogenesis and NO signaling